jgi:hypothetical protein
MWSTQGKFFLYDVSIYLSATLPSRAGRPFKLTGTDGCNDSAPQMRGPKVPWSNSCTHTEQKQLSRQDATWRRFVVV